SGIMELDNQGFNLLPGGEEFADENVYVIMEYGANSLLLGTTANGLFLLQDGKKKALKTEADAHLKNNTLYSGLQLEDAAFAFGTLRGGLIIINQQGQLISAITGEDFLPTLQVNNLNHGDPGTIWASLDNGIAKIEYPSAFTNFGEHAGIAGGINKIVRYKQNLLVGSRRGLLHLVQRQESPEAYFRIFQEIKNKIWDLLVFDDLLLTAQENGVFQFDGTNLTSIGQWNPSSFYRSKVDPNRVFMGLADGVGSIYRKDGRWINEGKIQGVVGSTYTILEENSGNLWLETSEDWVWNISFPSKSHAKNLKNPICRRYGTEQGLPGVGGNLYQFQDRVFFAAFNLKKTFEYQVSSDRFIPEQSLSAEFGLPQSILLEHLDDNHHVWFRTFQGTEALKRMVAWHQNGDFHLQDLSHSRILNFSDDLIFPELSEDSIVWLVGELGLIRHDLQKQKNRRLKRKCLIRNVIYGNDSLVYAGNTNEILSELISPFKHSGNQFRFTYAYPTFLLQQQHKYQYLLEPYDQNWSEWNDETQKDYTNLPEGDYTFKVRAKDLYGEISEEDQFTFSILPPWYRTWWAYLCYALVLVGFMSSIIQWRSSQLRKEKEFLETEVAHRTAEIKDKNQQLEHQTHTLAAQAEKLQEMDHLKSRLFANISHEFRTPLTLIKGPVEQLLKDSSEKLSLTHSQMINRNADRLLRLVNQLLDLSKLDSGKLHLNATEGDFFKFLRRVASSFSSHAAQRDLDYEINIPNSTLWTSFDKDKVENIIYNLLANAFKFTEDGGIIGLSAVHESDQLTLTITDNGKGLTEKQLPRIFDRFYQVDNSYTREHEGTGIGLALTQELVNLMKGEITVESSLGQGSTFTATFPLEEIRDRTSQLSLETQDIPLTSANYLNSSQPIPDNGTDKVAILVVEDNKDMRHYIGEHLRDDYSLFEAKHGQAGWEMAIDQVPDLIITDLMMPKMDGMELCGKLKNDERTSHIPVIMLTAKAGQENKLEGLETGADDYLTKPFNAQELRIRVKNLIEQRRKLQQHYSKLITLEPKKMKITSMDERFLQKVMDLLDLHMEDTEFGVPQMQEALAMSKTQLHCKMKALTDMAPGKFQRNYRLKKAAQILSRKGDSVTQVAYRVGFSNLSHFAKCFKEVYGVSPSEYHH
ncbi:MAG: response regulator, partial [Cyclobacteriaceae bacterium]|nr:response regulator [Cyclobacteriaceae bacterium]